MPLNWSGMFTSYGSIREDDAKSIKEIVDSVVDVVDSELTSNQLAGLPTIFTKPWSIAIGCDAEKYFVAFMKPATGRLRIHLDVASPDRIPLEQFTSHIKSNFDIPVTFAFTHPKGRGVDQTIVQEIAVNYLSQMVKEMTFSALGDLTGLEHLHEPISRFLADHPDPSKNVFLMMRFMDTPQMREIHSALVDSLAPHGYKVLRADDRAYTDELWSNILVYITGSNLGIAVFEDIEQRDFNPNVAYELGYMRAKGKKCLILKERRLPSVPSDVIHNLYRQFDSYSIQESIKRQIDEWVTRDLR